MTAKHLKLVMCIILGLFSFLFGLDKEFRGIVIQGNDWAADSPEEMKSSIIQLMDQASQKRLNAVFFQVRENGERYYQSDTETWSSKLYTKNPGFDPIQFAMNEAHDRNLQFHAVFDVLPFWNIATVALPQEHLYRQHKEWTLKENNDLAIEYSGSQYLQPFNPEVISYLKERIRHFITEYRVDGIQFSGLEFPVESLNNQDVINQYKNDTKIKSMSKEEWARQIMNNLLEALSAEIKLYKPYLVLSAQTHAMYREVRTKNYSKSALKALSQDGIHWLEQGLVDFIVPVIYDKDRYFDELYESYLVRDDLNYYILPLCTGEFGALISIRDLAKEYDYIMEKDAAGILLGAAVDMLNENIDKFLFEEAADPPYLARTHFKTEPADLDFSALSEQGTSVHVNGSDFIRIIDAEGYLTMLSTKWPRTLSMKTDSENYRFDTRNWKKPNRYVVKDNRTLDYPDQYIELRRSPEFMTTDSSFNFLFKSSPGDSRINDISVDRYENTGIFFKEFPLESQGTIIHGSIRSGDSYLYYEDRFYGNMPDTSTKLLINKNSVSPSGLVRLTENDVLRISFRSDMPDSIIAISLFVNKKPLPVWYNGSEYVGNIHCDRYASGDTLIIQAAAKSRSETSVAVNFPLIVTISKDSDFPVVETIEDFTPVSYSRGKVRLGGPYLNEFAKGVRFRTDGKFGKHYRIRLSDSRHVYIDEKYVKSLGKNMPAPSYHLSNISISRDNDVDKVVIPWPEPVPYAIYPEPESNRLRISLYGTECSSTWLSHRSELKMVDYVTWEQRVDGQYDVLVYLKNKPLWGYNLVQNKRSLTLNVKHEPDPENLRIAVEAGHGGPYNWGAVGLSGLKEKDINRDTADKLIELLREMGYDVIDVREKDTGPYLRERWLKVDSLDADLFISIHANAAGGDYLRVGGTSTYYNNPFWKDFAEIGYERLLELDLEEFGTVGSFNYMMCRMTQRPAMLVEQGFLSHAGDENKLADPAFRQDIAERLVVMVEEYLDMMYDY